MFNMNKIIAIIPAAWKPTNTINASYNNLPDCMIPINSKPVIWHILDDLISRDIFDALILLNKNDIYTEKYVSIRYSKKMTLFFKYIEDSTRWIIWSIKQWLAWIDFGKYDSSFIYLWDTIYKWELDFSSSFLTIKGEYDNSELWCFVEQKLDKLKFVNKPKDYIWDWKILTWLYFFKDSKIFTEILFTLNSWELYLLLEKYSQNDKFELVDSQKWYDIWNIDNYYKAKIDFLKIRSFNNVIYDDVYGTITKSSRNHQKIVDEINWYKNIPSDLQVFAPRLINYNIWEKPFYEIEYYWYQSLWDLFLFWYLNKNVWFSIIDKLFQPIKLFKKHTTDFSNEHFQNIYYKKTIDRLYKLMENQYFDELIKKDKITINWKIYNNISFYLPKLKDFTDTLYDENDVSFIHWDYCLSNILFDTWNKIIKMIDPRWDFWQKWVYWDIKYDLAKLRHSFVWYYDFIVSDLFSINQLNVDTFEFDIYNDEIHKDISSYFDIKLLDNWYNLIKIKLIESLLFLSMIPLHSDSFERQKAMYLTSVMKLNDINLNQLLCTD